MAASCVDLLRSVSRVNKHPAGLGQESRFMKGPFRTFEYQMTQFNHTAEELRKRYQKDDFAGSTNFHARRSVALLICGWKFNRADLEQELRKYTSSPRYLPIRRISG